MVQGGADAVRRNASRHTPAISASPRIENPKIGVVPEIRAFVMHHQTKSSPIITLIETGLLSAQSARELRGNPSFICFSIRTQDVLLPDVRLHTVKRW